MSVKTLHDLHRPLGSTGLLVSALGLGTVKLGRDQGVKYPNGFQIPGDDEARMLLKLARDMGINLIDTAPAYGRSEERLGPLLRGQRQDWVIVSKVGEEFADGQSSHDFSAITFNEHVNYNGGIVRDQGFRKAIRNISPNSVVSDIYIFDYSSNWHWRHYIVPASFLVT